MRIINLNDTHKMKPSKELLHEAKAKAKATFKPNRNNTIQSIRLTSDEKSYTLFYLAGIYYIGTYTNEALPSFFKNKSVYQMQDADGKVNAEMQRLIVR